MARHPHPKSMAHVPGCGEECALVIPDLTPCGEVCAGHPITHTRDPWRYARPPTQGSRPGLAKAAPSGAGTRGSAILPPLRSPSVRALSLLAWANVALHGVGLAF